MALTPVFLWFCIKTEDGNFYYSGDTALTMDMKLIPEWAEFDFAVLPIGDGLTMGVEDAIKASGFVGVKKVIGVHYDTFGLIKIDHFKAIAAFDEAGIMLHLLDIPSIIEIKTVRHLL